jgi:hypothetical protein
MRLYKSEKSGTAPDTFRSPADGYCDGRACGSIWGRQNMRVNYHLGRSESTSFHARHRSRLEGNIKRDLEDVYLRMETGYPRLCKPGGRVLLAG